MTEEKTLGAEWTVECRTCRVIESGWMPLNINHYRVAHPDHDAELRVQAITYRVTKPDYRYLYACPGCAECEATK